MLSAIGPWLALPLMAGCGGRSGDATDAADAGGAVAPSGPANGTAETSVALLPPPRNLVDPVPITADLVASGLSSPWALCFLPDGGALVTERTGQLRRVSASGAISTPLSGVPDVSSAGQGGLLDLITSPAFTQDRTVFFSFSEPRGEGLSATAVARAVLDGNALTAVEVIFRQNPARSTDVHYGSRLAFDSVGMLVVTLGERGLGSAAQDVTTTLGKTVRIRSDGGLPADAPAVVQAGALPTLWTIGHRNPQGLARNPWTGNLWLSEHGARGGDEINRLRAGRNYGWPRITSSLDYATGQPLGEGRSAPDVEAPLFSWEPVSPAPAGMLFYTGDGLPGWKGSLLVGMLAGRRLSRLDTTGDTVVSETRYLESLGERIRDIRQAPDGHPWFVTDGGRLYRIRPVSVPVNESAVPAPASDPD